MTSFYKVLVILSSLSISALALATEKHVISEKAQIPGFLDYDFAMTLSAALEKETCQGLQLQVSEASKKPSEDILTLYCPDIKLAKLATLARFRFVDEKFENAELFILLDEQALEAFSSKLLTLHDLASPLREAASKKRGEKPQIFALRSKDQAAHLIQKAGPFKQSASEIFEVFQKTYGEPAHASTESEFESLKQTGENNHAFASWFADEHWNSLLLAFSRTEKGGFFAKVNFKAQTKNP